MYENQKNGKVYDDDGIYEEMIVICQQFFECSLLDCDYYKWSPMEIASGICLIAFISHKTYAVYNDYAPSLQFLKGVYPIQHDHHNSGARHGTLSTKSKDIDTTIPLTFSFERYVDKKISITIANHLLSKFKLLPYSKYERLSKRAKIIESIIVMMNYIPNSSLSPIHL